MTTALIPETERIPLKEKGAFSLGIVLEIMGASLLTNLFLPIFNIGFGMTPVAIGIILMLLRAWDGCLDPIVGYISDNFPTRWGRRRPYMLVGAIGCAVLFPLFWFMPASLSDTGKFLYLLVCGMAFYLAYSFWAMPYYGLQLELTPNYHERTRLSAWMTVVSNVMGIIMGWHMAWLASSMFANPLTGEPDLVNGIRHLCWVFAAGIAIFGIMPALFVKERTLSPRSKEGKMERESFWQNIRESLHNGPLWIVIGITFFLVTGLGVIGGVGTYVFIYYVTNGDLALAGVIGGWKGSVITVCGLALIPVWTWLAKFLDKRTLVIITLFISVFGHLLGYFLITPANPYLSIIPGIFESAGFTAIWLLIPSMKGDIADFDELQTGRRREGAINAFFSWFFKVAVTVSAGLGGWLLQATGFVVNVNSADPVIHQRMFMSYLFVPLGFWAVGLFLIWIYPLTQERMATIRREIEARRGLLVMEK